MPKIGTFTRSSTGFAGHIRTLSFDMDFVLIAVDRPGRDNAPDYRLHLGDADGPEVGAGWTRTGERAGTFIAVQLDDPVFLAPIRARLFRDGETGDVWSLHWSRPQSRGDRD